MVVVLQPGSVSDEPQSQQRQNLVEQEAAHFMGSETEDRAPRCLIPINTNYVSWGTLHGCVGSKARSVPELTVPPSWKTVDTVWPLYSPVRRVLEGVLW